MSEVKKACADCFKEVSAKEPQIMVFRDGESAMVCEDCYYTQSDIIDLN